MKGKGIFRGGCGRRQQQGSWWNRLKVQGRDDCGGKGASARWTTRCARIDPLESRRLLSTGYGEAFALFTDATLTTPGLVGSYVNQSLRSVDQVDWRGGAQPISGTRVDSTLFFSTNSLGSRAGVGVTGGSDTNWDQFSVQWDGVVRVLVDGTKLATRSDDGSRLWVDLNRNGVFENPQERFDNSWGTGHGASVGNISPPLGAGVYPIRIQFEEGDGDNNFSLLANPVQPVGSFTVYTDATFSTPGLIGSYVNRNLSSVTQPDWRLTQMIAGTRVDPQINFTSSSWGARASVGLTGGSDADWDQFSVQWDGVVQISESGTRLATVSDDSSRMWIDLNHDGVFDNTGPELISNHWGQGQAATLGPGSPALAAGVYPIRIQYEEQYWGNVMQLVPAPAMTLRVAYVIPSNRTPQASAVANIQDYIPRLQQWYGEQMERWGFGRRSFIYEAQADGVTPQVHVTYVGVTDAYLREDLWGRAISAAAAASVRTWSEGEIWLLFSEAHVENADGSISGGTALGAGYGSGSGSGIAMLGGDALFRLSSAKLLDNQTYAGQIVPELGTVPLVQSTSFPWFEGSTFSSIASSIQGAAAHELGHGFGQPHDFRNDSNFRGPVMGNGLRGMRGASYPDSYPADDMWLSYGNALALSVNRYFRPDFTASENTGPTLTVSTSGTVNPVNGLLQVAFQASDSSGLAAAFLIRNGDLVAEMPLSGTSVNVALATPYYRPGQDDQYSVSVYDQQGNRTEQSVTIRVNSGLNRAPEPHIKLSDSRPTVGQSVTLDASATADADHSASSLTIEWDLNGDGMFEIGPSTSKTYTTQFPTVGTRIVTARITDPNGARAVSAPLTLRVVGPPTGMTLSGSSVAENQPAGSVVGTLSTTDPDVGDAFIYSLVSGVGSGDNGSFTIVGNELKTKAAFDYEVKDAYSIRVQTTDATGMTFQKPFTVMVTNVNEAPNAEAGGPYLVGMGTEFQLNAADSADPDTSSGDQVVLYEWDLDNDGTYELQTENPILVEPPAETSRLGEGIHAISLRVTDGHGLFDVDTATLDIRGGSISGTDGNDRIAIALNMTNPTRADVWINQPGSVPTYSVDLSHISQWQVLTDGGDDELIVDFSHGNPLPSAGLNYHAGEGASGDRLIVRNPKSNDKVALESPHIKLNDEEAIAANGVEFFGFDLGGEGGGNVPGTNGLLKMGAGRLVLSGKNTYTGGTTVQAGSVEVTSAGALPAGGSLVIGAGGTMVLSSGLIVASEADEEENSAATTGPFRVCVAANAVGGQSQVTLQPFCLLAFSVTQSSQDAVRKPLDIAAKTRQDWPRGFPSLPAKAHDTVLQAVSMKRPASDLSWLWVAEQLNQRVAAKRPIALGSAVDEALGRLWK